MKLAEYLEQDSQAVHAALQQAQTPAQTRTALEQELDRILLRFNEDCEDERQREAAMHMLQTARTALPLAATSYLPLKTVFPVAMSVTVTVP